ncbi:MAG: hypothetical protein ACLQAT_01505 [Candidatus Binataceae bacterium]
MPSLPLFTNFIDGRDRPEDSCSTSRADPDKHQFLADELESSRPVNSST